MEDTESDYIYWTATIDFFGGKSQVQLRTSLSTEQVYWASAMDGAWNLLDMKLSEFETDYEKELYKKHFKPKS